MPSKAKFSIKTKKEIYERDWGRCIFCPKPPTDIHHIFFWTESNYWPDRNAVNQWVTVCRDCHIEIHSCSKWEWKRQQAIEVLN
jgi:hypothetical protein